MPNHEAMLWSLLLRLGVVATVHVDAALHRAHLRASVGDAPPIVEIIHRHAITAADAPFCASQ